LNENEWEEHIAFIKNLPENQREEAINEIKSYFITELVKKYLLTSQEIKNNKDKSPEVRRNNLKKLLEPIIWLNKFIHGKDNPLRITFPAWEGRPYDRSYYPFINEGIIDLDTEIDISKIKSNAQKYHIYYNGNIINMRHDKISFSTRSECLLAEYYDEWILKITTETMHGNVDLLDNVLFIYAIKRALNGDKKATEKLYSIYERRAEVEAIKLAQVNASLAKKIDEDDLDYKEIISNSKFVLLHIISGIRPESLISDLQKDKRDNTLLTPKWAEDFYIWYFSEYLPPLLNEGVDLFEKNTEDLLLRQTIINLLSPYMAINVMTSWKSKDKKRIFNSDSFRPTKKTNLTVWLFGTDKEPMNGRFMQTMKNILDRNSNEQNHISEQIFDEKTGKYPGEKILYPTDKIIDLEDEEIKTAIIQCAKNDQRLMSILNSTKRRSVADQKYFERKIKAIRERFKPQKQP